MASFQIVNSNIGASELNVDFFLYWITECKVFINKRSLDNDQKGQPGNTTAAYT